MCGGWRRTVRRRLHVRRKWFGSRERSMLRRLHARSGGGGPPVHRRLYGRHRCEEGDCGTHAWTGSGGWGGDIFIGWFELVLVGPTLLHEATWRYGVLPSHGEVDYEANSRRRAASSVFRARVEVGKRILRLWSLAMTTRATASRALNLSSAGTICHGADFVPVARRQSS